MTNCARSLASTLASSLPMWVLVVAMEMFRCGGFYLAVTALIGLGIGGLVRHTAGAITVVVAFLYLVPEIGNSLPSPWNWDFVNAFPSTAAQQITQSSSRASPAGCYAAGTPENCSCASRPVRASATARAIAVSDRLASRRPPTWV
jgi:hypothetical protein